MNMQNRDTPDLSSLINQAQNSVSESAKEQAAHKKQRQSHSLRLVFPLVALSITGFMIYTLWAEHVPPSKQQVGKDLEGILYQARDAIEGNRGPDGELPESIPNASLAAIVQYDSDTNRYKLTTTIMGVRVTLEQDGKTITHNGGAE